MNNVTWFSFEILKSCGDNCTRVKLSCVECFFQSDAAGLSFTGVASGEDFVGVTGTASSSSSS